jgi:hypothetical protein
MANPYDEDIGASPEHIAFRLLEVIMAAEKKDLASGLDRQRLLDTYGECLATVRGLAHKPGMKVSPDAVRSLGRRPRA